MFNLPRAALPSMLAAGNRAYQGGNSLERARNQCPLGGLETFPAFHEPATVLKSAAAGK